MNATTKLLWFVCALLVSAAAAAHGIAPYPDAVPRTRSAGAALLELALLSARAGSVSITVEGDFRVIRADGLPDHATGHPYPTLLPLLNKKQTFPSASLGLHTPY